MNEKLNIETRTERHNLIVTEAIEKKLEDEKCEPEIALA